MGWMSESRVSGLRRSLALLALSAVCVSTVSSWGGVTHRAEMLRDEPQVGQKAPDFSLVDLDGRTHVLGDYKGRIVVLEWFNPASPYVVDQYTKRTLKTFGNSMKKTGVVYLAINSTAESKPGSGVDANVEARGRFGMEFPILLDSDGRVAGLYRARFTPHIFVIDGKGVLRYMGAIDNAPLGKVIPTYPVGSDTEPGSVVNYAGRAIDEIRADQGVSIPKTKPYGSKVER